MTVLLNEMVSSNDKVIIASSKPHPELNGKELSEAASLLGCSQQEAVQELLPATAFYFCMAEEDVKAFLAHPLGMIGSDGLYLETPHPQLWGTFPRYLGHYVNSLKLVSFDEAIRKITSLPARTFGLIDRGEIKTGSYADLVLFDKRTIKDAATFDNPKQVSRGIKSVYVNGKLAWNDENCPRESLNRQEPLEAAVKAPRSYKNALAQKMTPQTLLRLVIALPL